ncbi:family 1 glycosylhydrolase (plasmid) [Mesorhizobium sp. AR02]|uniref:family 1 glycosylhydrolase n=1 Tax=Mesorhizobium sp. AR02 TaxID=2865837 RepID=UPI00215FFA84|nr:family 1 glycosylhydrolase [Mesorhizobium sp. AR02]UVK57378.1 family 1 glycosylhydrolase [Mesorhizobium sp. AR02]
MSAALQMWGGVECSHVRIHDMVRDQLHETGHFDRIDDLDRIAGLGIRTLRYPVLWDMVERERGVFDWSWTDARLHRLREHGIRPIAGLMHHGSGPVWAPILAPDFADRFAAYAEEVAQRYPWIELYTPVNEPFTTARISGLYGLWQPHGASEAVCLQLTVAQCRATALAMKAIRKHAPHARLVQTEDVGRIYSTAHLAYQADYENERRWLALDLLSGRVDTRHPFREGLLAAGVEENHISALAKEPCTPDIIGIDYYLTSDRMLDERCDRHPAEKIGGNGIDSYVDIAAVRSDARREAGLGARIGELWGRYHLPVAVTELHNGSTRDEQLRWLVEGWTAAQEAKASGIEICSVTAWSLFGAVDWNSMLSARAGYYEPGAFDVRAGEPRPTALADAIEGLARRGCVDHPVLDRRGWWREDIESDRCGRPIVLLGSGRMIAVIQECCSTRRLPVVSAGPGNARKLMAAHGGWAAIRIEDRRPTRVGMPAGPVRIFCEFPDGSRLIVRSDDPAHAQIETANAALDLAIDGQRGGVQLTERGPHNQYRLVPLARDVQGLGQFGAEVTSEVA